MSTTETFKLAGIYRPRNRGPGFGIPVFSHDGQYWVQETFSEGRVMRFVTCDVEANALYAFEATDGTIKLGKRREF